jgi:hypothetical protein
MERQSIQPDFHILTRNPNVPPAELLIISIIAIRSQPGLNKSAFLL